MTTENQYYNTAGQETSYTFTGSAGGSVTCLYDPHGDGPDSPVRVGQTWQIDYTFTCGTAAAVAYQQSGTVAAVESVAVPGGTFSALKLESTVTWTDTNGTTRVQTITNWRDIATSRSVKQQISIQVSGTRPSNGYAVMREILLESAS